MKLLKLYFFLNSIYWTAESCGITTHTVIGRRASTLYDHPLGNNNQTSIATLLTKHIAAFQAGNPYPDLFYGSQCLKGTKNDVSEDTHWVPFLNATINYIRRTYSQPYNSDALNLIAFTLGFASHQMADVTWHSLGIQQGFLSAMGFVNFHGSFDQAHSVGDIGGDIMNHFELDLEYISDLGNWYVPAEDLYKIYLEFYGEERVTRENIIECSSILFLGRLAEQLAASLLYEDYANKSTFLDDKLNEYFLGGLNDMAAWTQISWDKVLNMIENGTDKCHLPQSSRSILDLDCEETDFDSSTNKYQSFNNSQVHSISKYQSILGNDKSFLSIQQDGKGVKLSPSKKYQTLNNFHKSKKSTATNPSVKSDSPVTSLASYSVTNAYANLGHSLASGDINNDNSDDLLIGAPVFSSPNLYQNGAAFLVLSQPNSSIPIKDLDLTKYSDLAFYPPSGPGNQHSRFGHSTLILDINQDGFMDVIIAAPSYNLFNLSYEGRVFIYLGDHNNTYTNISIQITCNNYKYCNLGWALAKGDVNGDKIDDLIISSPYSATCGDQCGYVGVLFSVRKEFKGLIDAGDLDYVLTGSMGYEWFGHSAVAKFGYLAVGAPQSRLCNSSCQTFSKSDAQSVGRVYLFKYPSKSPHHILNGTTEFEQFGYSFDLAMNANKSVILAVSSVTKAVKLNNAKLASNLKNGGMVQMFNLDRNLEFTADLKSDRSFADFGSKVKFLGADLYVSGQKRSSNVYFKVPQGVVWKFEGGVDFEGHVTDECSFFDERPCPNEKANKVYTNGEDKSKFGFEFLVLDLEKKGRGKLVISSVFSGNEDLLMSGKVNIFELYNNNKWLGYELLSTTRETSLLSTTIKNSPSLSLMFIFLFCL